MPLDRTLLKCVCASLIVFLEIILFSPTNKVQILENLDEQIVRTYLDNFLKPF